MPTSGLVLSLPMDPIRAQAGLQAANRLPEVAIGAPVDGRFLPATIHADEQTTSSLIKQLEAHPDIEQVSITWIGLDEPEVTTPTHDAPTQEVPS